MQVRTSASFEVPRRLFPVEHRFLELRGFRIHYVDEGAGDTLLLLHGNPTWSFLYRKVIAELTDDFRLVALDFPGYGLSDAPSGYGFTPREHSLVLERFVDAVGLNDLMLMVQDWGGPIGLGLAGRRPELVRSLVIGNSFAWPLDDQRRFVLFSRFMGGPVGRFLTALFNFVPRFFLARGFARRPSREAFDMYLAPFRDRARREPAVVAPRQLVAASPYLHEVESNLVNIADRPALIIWGLKDFAFRDSERQRFERIFVNHETILLNNASHFLQEDAGVEIADAIRTFHSRLHSPET